MSRKSEPKSNGGAMTHRDQINPLRNQKQQKELKPMKSEKVLAKAKKQPKTSEESTQTWDDEKLKEVI